MPPQVDPYQATMTPQLALGASLQAPAAAQYGVPLGPAVQGQLQYLNAHAQTLQPQPLLSLAPDALARAQQQGFAVVPNYNPAAPLQTVVLSAPLAAQGQLPTGPYANGYLQSTLAGLPGLDEPLPVPPASMLNLRSSLAARGGSPGQSANARAYSTLSAEELDFQRKEREKDAYLRSLDAQVEERRRRKEEEKRRALAEEQRMELKLVRDRDELARQDEEERLKKQEKIE